MQSFFAEAADCGGLRAKMRLAELTQTPTALASVLEDTPDLMNRFGQALAQVRKEVGDERTSSPPIDARLIDTAPDAQWLEAGRSLLAERDSYIAQPSLTARRVTETAARTLMVERAGVWLLDPHWTKLECIDLYELSVNEHSRGMTLLALDYRAYFEAITTERVMDAVHAQRDPRTKCLTSTYLAPLAISSLMDVPLWCRGELRGVLCSEHVGKAPRAWSLQEESFGLMLTQVMSMSLELERS